MRIKSREYFNVGATEKLIIFSELTPMDETIDRELEFYENKKLFDENKDQTFADIFITEAEKLFEEKGYFTYAGTRFQIEEMRKTIKDYKAWRVFMQALQFITFTYSVTNIPEMAQMVFKGKKEQRIKAQLPRTNKNGLSPQQKDERNQKIISAFARKKGTDNAFYVNQGKKHHLSPSAIRKIVELKIVKP